MLGITIIFIFQNIILLTLLFWFLSFIGVKFFKEKNNNNSLEFFECGFNTLSKLNFKLNFNIFLITVLLILYDVEFLLLVPYFYNFTISSFFSILILTIFFFFIVTTFIYDWQLTSLNWNL